MLRSPNSRLPRHLHRSHRTMSPGRRLRRPGPRPRGAEAAQPKLTGPSCSLGQELVQPSTETSTASPRYITVFRPGPFPAPSLRLPPNRIAPLLRSSLAVLARRLGRLARSPSLSPIWCPFSLSPPFFRVGGRGLEPLTPCASYKNGRFSTVHRQSRKPCSKRLSVVSVHPSSSESPTDRSHF
jgi:hypothetical protein